MQVDLSKRAMLVSVTIKLEGLLGERRDRGASELVENHYSVSSRRAKASKYLIDRKHPKVKAVIATAQQVRAVVYRYTFPWGDSNLRLLPVAAHNEFQGKLKASLADLRAAQEEYLYAYPGLVRASESELGGLFDKCEYPPTDKVRTMFKTSTGYWPMPEGGHFVADIAAQCVTEARQTIEHDNAVRTSQAINDLIARVEQTVSVFVDKLANYRVDASTDKVYGIFRDSLISNVKDIGHLMKTLNFTDDPGIEQLASHVERLGRYSAETLRETAAYRNMMVSDGQQLLAKLDAFKHTDVEVDGMIDAVSDYT
jgi:hypothetical protein